MLGTNKVGTTSRLAGNYYEPNLSNIRFRKERISHFSTKVYIGMESHIVYQYYSDIYDIIVGDRVISDGIEYVFIGVMPHLDELGKHLECYIRQIGPSQFHTPVKIMRLDSAQPEFDDILKEFKNNSKEYTEIDSYMLIDPINRLSGNYLKLIEFGRIEDLDFVAIVDKPQNIEKTDYIVYNGVDYDLKFITEYPFQTIIGLKKSILNYKSKDVGL